MDPLNWDSWRNLSKIFEYMVLWDHRSYHWIIWNSNLCFEKEAEPGFIITSVPSYRHNTWCLDNAQIRSQWVFVEAVTFVLLIFFIFRIRLGFAWNDEQWSSSDHVFILFPILIWQLEKFRFAHQTLHYCHSNCSAGISFHA